MKIFFLTLWYKEDTFNKMSFLIVDMEKKLYKSKNRVFSGVLGGIGEYLNVDPTIIRVVYALVTCFSMFFPAIIAYVIMAIIIPE